VLSAAQDGTVRPAALLFGTLSLLVEYLVIAPTQLVVLSGTKDLPVRPAVVFPFGLGIDAGGVRRGMAHGILSQGQVPGLAQELRGEEMAKRVGRQMEPL